MQPTPKKPQINQSSEKLFNILELLADAEEPMRLIDISETLEKNNSTTLRFLNTMLKCGYVMQEPETSRYYLTYKICNLANKVSAKTDLRSLIHPFLKDSSRSFGESACLSVDQGMKVVYIDVVDGPDQMIRSMQRIGNVAPLHATGVGKLFLTEYSEKQLDHFINTVGIPSITQNTITTKSLLLEELSKVAKQGYAIDEEECEIGARCVACPIYDYTNHIIAGISIAGPTSRFTEAFIKTRLQYLKNTALEVSKILGYKNN